MFSSFLPFHKKWIPVLLLLSLLITGCFTVIPAHKDVAEDCELWSREWELDLSESNVSLLHGSINCSEPECVLVVALSLVAIPVMSFIVSGSVVVVGNTVHWIEEQGSCEESMTQEAIHTLVQSAKSAGGVMIQSGNEFLKWLEQQSSLAAEKEEEGTRL